MKIAYLTAGAAGMYCGSCMLDNALARALIAAGDECLLIPVYTPIRTDEENVSIDRVFFGGVNVFLQQKLPLLKYLPSWMDSFLNNPKLIKKLTAKASETSPELLGALTESMLQGMFGRQKKEVERLVDWLSTEIKPDVVVMTNLLIGGCIGEIKRKLKVPVVVILQGDDIFLDSLPQKSRERCISAMQKIVPTVDRFVTHSRDYAGRMATLLNIESDKLITIPIGIDTKEFHLLQGHSVSASVDMEDATALKTTIIRPPTIGYFARMSPEKGLDLIVDAFIALAARNTIPDVRLEMAGWMGDHQQSYWQSQVERLNNAGLQARWTYRGSIDRKQKLAFFKSIDVFCVPTRYQEPKGLFALEAIASDVPYLLPDHGAFPELHSRIQQQLGFSIENSAEASPFGNLFASNNVEDLVANLERKLVQIESFRRIYGDPRMVNQIKDRIDREIRIETMAHRFRSVITEIVTAK